MEVDLETMLDIALAGPEIGPLNLHVLHGLMRNVFERLDISKERVRVDEDQSEFSDSCNFIKSKLDAMPKPATGDRRLRSKVSVIVSNYTRVPIGEHDDLDSISQCPLQIEERLKCVESALSSMKDFPSVDELRNWATTKSSPDTVVTDLWHFVSLNHRMNGAEEGIQKLTELVDKLIPELKSVWEEGIHMSGRIDDLYSQFKGLSDRVTNIDNKLDTASSEIIEQLNEMERRLSMLPTFTDLKDYVHMNRFVEAEDAARRTASELRDSVSKKLDATKAYLFASKDELASLDKKIYEIDDKFYSGLKELNNCVTKDSLAESADNLYESISLLDKKVDYKADAETVGDLQSKFEDNFARVFDDIGNLRVSQSSLKDELEENRKCMDTNINRDISSLTEKVHENRSGINALEEWKEEFEGDEKPLILSRLDQHDKDANMFRRNFSALNDEEKRREREKEEEEDQVSTKYLQDLQMHLQDRFNAFSKSCNEDISQILNQLDNKSNKDEISQLKEFIDNYQSKNQQKTEQSSNGLDDSRKMHTAGKDIAQNELGEYLNLENQSPFQVHVSPNDRNKSSLQQNENINGHHQPSPPYHNRSKSQISPKRFTSAGENLGCSHPHYESTQFTPYRDDAAIIRTQMKFNCLSCGRPLCMQGNNQMQTTRGRPVNAYDLENMKLLQNMLNQQVADKDKRACGGRHTTVIPLNCSVKPSAKILPMVSTNTPPLVDEEVDIEGVDGRLYRGLVNKTELPMLQKNTP